MVLPPLKSKIDIATLSQLRFGLVVLVLTFSIGCQCPWSCSKGNLAESSRWLQGGLEAYHEGQHIEAQELLSKAAETRPTDPILREHLAENYLQQGKTTEAIAELMQAADISGNDASVLVKIGNLYLAGGQQFPAEQYAKKALAANRKLPSAWVLNAEIKMAKGQLTEALSDYQRALSLDNGDPEVQIRIAEVQRLLGRPLRALSTVEQMLARMPEPSQPEEALLLSGRLLMELKQSAQAIEKLQLAVSKPNASAESHIQLAQTHLAVGQFDLARNTLLSAQQKFPNAAVFDDKLKLLPNGKERIAALNVPKGEYVR